MGDGRRGYTTNRLTGERTLSRTPCIVFPHPYAGPVRLTGETRYPTVG